MEGYQLHASDVNEMTQDPHLRCPNCNFLVRDAMILPTFTLSGCDHIFCSSCLDDMCVNGHGTAVCPVDGEDLCEAIPDDTVRHEVLARKVHCTFRDDGCAWEGKVKHLETHVERVHGEGDAAAEATEVAPFQPNASIAKRKMGALVVEGPHNGAEGSARNVTNRLFAENQVLEPDNLLRQMGSLRNTPINNWHGAHCYMDREDKIQPRAFIASGGLPSSTSAADGQSQLPIHGPSGVNVDPVPDYGAEPQGAGLAENEQSQQQGNKSMTSELFPQYISPINDDFFQLSAGEEQSGPPQSQQARSGEKERGPPPMHVWEENKKLKMLLASERQDHERLQEQWQARLQRLEQQLAAFKHGIDDEKRDRERALENEKRDRERALENEKRDRERALENEKRDRERALENEKRDRERALENEKRDRERALENEKRDRERALENEKRDREQQLEAQRNRCDSHHEECFAERQRAVDDEEMQNILIVNHMVNLQSSHADLQERLEAQRNRCDSHHEECFAERQRAVDDGEMQNILIVNQLENLQEQVSGLEGGRRDLNM